MPPAHCTESSSHQFHEAYQKQQTNSSSVGQPAAKQHESESEQSRQRTISAWSSSSSSSSLSTGSLFSLLSDSSTSMRYKKTGVLFDDLDSVPLDKKVDPKAFACFNCWGLDHDFCKCPRSEIHKYCRNCGRRGVTTADCPRCARGYVDYMNRKLDAISFSVKTEEPTPLKVIEERSGECWDLLVKDHQKSPDAAEYQQNDWDSYQSPRVNMIEKSIKVYSLNAKKAEVAKYKDDSWSDGEMSSYSYSWRKYGSKTKDVSFSTSKAYYEYMEEEEHRRAKFELYGDTDCPDYHEKRTKAEFKTAEQGNPCLENIPEERAKDKIEDYDGFGDNTCQDLSLNKNSQFKSFINSVDERAERDTSDWNSHEKVLRGSVPNSKCANLIINNETKVNDDFETWSDCSGCTMKNLQERSTGTSKAVNLISNGTASLTDQNSWSDKNVDVFERSKANFASGWKEQNSNTPQMEEDWSDAEAYQSLQASFCEEPETHDLFIALDGTLDEEYWTDFDDDYNSLEASFAEEYKSLNNTVDDDTDGKNIFGIDTLNSKEKPTFYDSFYATRNTELFSFVKKDKLNDLFAANESNQPFNSLESSICSQSDDTYLSQDEDDDDYESMIIDENERSESYPFAGQAVQEFLKLLDLLKHLPIQTQNIAVLHFISKQKEESWRQGQMQNRI